MKNILVPTDFSPYSRTALHYAAQIAAISGGTVTLMHVNNKPPENMQEILQHFWKAPSTQHTACRASKRAYPNRISSTSGFGVGRNHRRYAPPAF
ncbi:MAG: universal stress protein [Sphingobacteriales bacterium]|nr:universal stress protein [Sphingobacteriales bacterium]